MRSSPGTKSCSRAPSERRNCPPSRCCFAVPGRNCYICAATALILAALLTILGILVIAEKRRYTPVYETVYLKPTGTAFGNVRLRPISVELEVYVDITNPNPYDLFVVNGGQGKAVVGSQMMELGSVFVTDTVIPARPRNRDPPSIGRVVMTAQLEADLWQTLTAASLLLQGAFTVYFELLVNIFIEPDMLGLRVARLGEGVHQFCGLQVQLLPSQVAGDVVCGDSFESLEVPLLYPEVPPASGSETEAPESETQANEGDGTSTNEGFAPPIDEASINEAAEIRDLIAGWAMAVCFSLAGLLSFTALSLGVWALLARPKSVYSTKGANGASGAPDDADGTSVAHGTNGDTGNSAPVQKIGHSMDEEEP